MMTEDYNWALEVIERFYTKGSELYNILVKHSKSVADEALRIVTEKHLDVDKSFVYRAAMLHDIGIIKCDAGGIFCCGFEQYICHGYLGADMLRSIGLDKYALVAERHTGTGLTAGYIAEKSLPLPPDRIYVPQSIEERVICYADKFFSKTKLDKKKDYDSVLRSLQKFGPETVERFIEMNKEFSTHETIL